MKCTVRSWFLFTLVADNNKNIFCLITLQATPKQTILAHCQKREREKREKK